MLRTNCKLDLVIKWSAGSKLLIQLISDWLDGLIADQMA